MICKRVHELSEVTVRHAHLRSAVIYFFMTQWFCEPPVVALVVTDRAEIPFSSRLGGTV